MRAALIICWLADGIRCRAAFRKGVCRRVREQQTECGKPALSP